MAEEITKKDQVKGRSTFDKVMNIILWIVLLGWMAVCITDFIQVQREKKPIFCLTKMKTVKYNDGTVQSCVGVGYKYFKYDRKSYKAIEFGPFWSKDRSADK